MSIGKVRKQRRKTHAHYRTPRVRHLLTKLMPLPGDSGFIHLVGSIKYRTQDFSAIVTISSLKRPDNHGPGVYIKVRLEDWALKDVKKGARVVRALDLELSKVAARVMNRTLPERGMFIDKCNSSGREVDKFIASTCSSCRSWYCELSSG